jgi:hypothetical protein
MYITQAHDLPPSRAGSMVGCIKCCQHRRLIMFFLFGLQYVCSHEGRAVSMPMEKRMAAMLSHCFSIGLAVDGNDVVWWSMKIRNLANGQCETPDRHSIRSNE